MTENQSPQPVPASRASFNTPEKPKKKRRVLKTALGVGAVLVLFAACSGGGDEPTPDATTAPAATSSSPATSSSAAATTKAAPKPKPKPTPAAEKTPDTRQMSDKEIDTVFLTTMRMMDEDFRLIKNETMIEAAHGICDELHAGNTIESVAIEILLTDGFNAENGGYLLGGAISAYCPEYEKDLDKLGQ